MGEKGVLKLVHPGRVVEIHTQPITAAEVLRKNPRHCITRPDVFRNPWIVVHPEAVLMPGRVFFIVPIRTIHRLLKESEHCKQSSTSQSDSPKATHDPWWSPKQFSPLRAWAGMTPKKIPHQFQIRHPESDKNLWGKSMANQRDSLQQFDGNSSMINYSNPSQPKPKDGELKSRRIGQATKSKSCLRKQDSVRKVLSLRVTFDLPNKEDEEWREDTLFPPYIIRAEATP